MTAAPPPIEYQLIGLTEGGDVGDLLADLDWRRWGFIPAKDDSLVLFRSIAVIAASVGG